MKDTPDNPSEAVLQKLTNVQQDLLHYVSAALVARPDDVWDVVQETNVAIISHLKDYQPDRPFLPWALGIARNKVLDYRRKQWRDKLVFDETLLDAYAQAAVAAASDEESYARRVQHLMACIDKLSPPQRDLIKRHYLEGLPLVKIANEQKKGESAVRMTVLRIRQAIADCMRRLCRLEARDGGEGSQPPPSPLDALMSRVIDRRDRKAAAALLDALHADTSAVAAYRDQMEVHLMLTEQGNLHPRAAARKTGRLLRLAAALALLLAGLGWAGSKLLLSQTTRGASSPAPDEAAAPVVSAPASSAPTAAIPLTVAETNTVSAPEKQGETRMKTNAPALFAAAAASFTLATSPTVKADDSAATNCGDSAPFLLETRLFTFGETPEQTFNTIPPHGTIYRFF